MQIPRRKSEELQRLKNQDTGPLYLTPKAIQQLRERLEQLKKSLPNLIVETQRTADYGDRSENAEYKDAKATLRRTHRQIYTIEDQLKRAIEIKSSNLGISDSLRVVEIGSTVIVESGGVQKTFQILGSFETKPEQGRTSYESPLGAALINHRKGDVVTINTPKGAQEYRILEIR